MSQPLLNRRKYGEMVPSGITFDGITQDIIDSINDGVFLIQHRDHGGVTVWGYLLFYISNFTSLTNGMKAPVVFSFNLHVLHYGKTTAVSGPGFINYIIIRSYHCLL